MNDLRVEPVGILCKCWRHSLLHSLQTCVSCTHGTCRSCMSHNSQAIQSTLHMKIGLILMHLSYVPQYWQTFCSKSVTNQTGYIWAFMICFRLLRINFHKGNMKLQQCAFPHLPFVHIWTHSEVGNTTVYAKKNDGEKNTSGLWRTEEDHDSASP